MRPIPIFFAVVFTVRADFFDKVLANRTLADKLEDAKVFISPMNLEELKQVIELPARKVNLQFEPGLTTRILNDVLGEPGNLPLLEFVLMELWKERRDNKLTHGAYEKIGELKGALALHAEKKLNKLNAEERQIAQRIFLRLIRTNINTEAEESDHANKVTRRRITFLEAGEENIPVVRKLASAHLIVTGRNDATGEDTIELVHETLINSWGTYKQWITEDQQFLAWRERLRMLMNLSADNNFSKNTLLRGELLKNANNWFKKRPLDFDVKEIAFVQKSNQKRKLELLAALLGTLGLLLILGATLFHKNDLKKSTKADGSIIADSASNNLSKTNNNFVDTTSTINQAPKNTPGIHAFSLTDILKLYNFPTELDGSGQTIGLIELGGGYRIADLNKFFTDYNIKMPIITPASVNGGTNHPTTSNSADGQVVSDIEIAGMAAPNAHLVVYFSVNTNEGYLNAINAAINDQANNPSIILVCWGAPESNWTTAAMNQINAAFQRAAAKGITVVVAAGDQGPGDGVEDGKPHVDFPASSPYVLACGGTKLIAANDTIKAEYVWNASNDSKTGGGMSNVFGLPIWQKNIIKGDVKGRLIPDVVANADPSTGYKIRVDGQNLVMGGTTLAAPLWAGLIARINQGLGKNIGYINPILYNQIGPAGILRDITIGNNKQGNLGYSATVGWDACSGWGSPDGVKLLNALKAGKK